MLYNPNKTEQAKIQKRGLEYFDRKPNDYMAMVARTFSTFRNTSSSESVTSYLNGFEVLYNDEEVVTSIVDDGIVSDNVENYNILTLRKGVCLVDNQLIDIYEDITYIYNFEELLPNKEWAVVIFYDNIECYQENVAEIKIMTKDSLIVNKDFEAGGQCRYKEIDESNASISYGGRPGLIIATFSTNNSGHFIRTWLKDGLETPGINPQYLSKLYMDNYVLLSKHFGTQARSEFSKMGLTQATFVSVNESEIDDNLHSGDMCFWCTSDNKYKRSIASRQKFDRVVGLYLNEYNEGNHLIYFNGLITFNQDKHKLDQNHTLLNLDVGKQYFLEDDCELFDQDHPTMTIENYTLSDSSGRITPRFFPGCVRVGTAIHCNTLLLNIDHSLEVGTGNLLSLFGNFEQYKKEYDANSVSISSQSEIDFLTDTNTFYGTKIDKLTSAIGDVTNEATISSWFASADDKFIDVMIEKIPDYTRKYDNTLTEMVFEIDDSLFAKYNITNQNDINQHKLNFTNFHSFNDIKFILNNLNNNILTRIVNKKASATGFTINNKTTRENILDTKLSKQRYLIQDEPTTIQSHENPELKANDVFNDYSSNIVDCDTIINDEYQTMTDRITVYKTQMEYIEYLSKISKKIVDIVYIIEDLISLYQNVIDESAIKIEENNTLIAELEIIRDEARDNIITIDPIALDIFLMDEHQRKIFNYTYITDRLKRRLYMIKTLDDQLDKARVTLSNLQINGDVIEKIQADQEVKRIENQIQLNNNMIDNYHKEYNDIRVNTFGIPPIDYLDIDFSDDGYADQKIGTFRYGCDNSDCYNGLCSNTITPCSE
jgi:hypothetical protein